MGFYRYLFWWEGSSILAATESNTSPRELWRTCTRVFSPRPGTDYVF